MGVFVCLMFVCLMFLRQDLLCEPADAQKCCFAQGPLSQCDCRIVVCTGALVNKNPAQGRDFELVFGLWSWWLSALCCLWWVMWSLITTLWYIIHVPYHTDLFLSVILSFPEHRQRFSVVHRPRVQTQPHPGTEEDAVPSLLTWSGHPLHLPTHPSTDISPQVRHDPADLYHVCHTHKL